MALSLRPYQLASIDAVFDYWTDGGGNPLVVLPTGAGKSLVLASLAERLIDQWSGMRIGVITHVKELIAQNAQELLRMWPCAPVGIFSAGLGRRDTRAQILFMGIQSVHKKACQLGGFDLLIVDECFPAGTMIATPNGSVSIEDLRPGDVVFNATGVGIVEALRKKPSNKLVRLDLSDGSFIECTENHPIFTEKGWVEAGKLARGSRLFGREEVRALFGGVPPIFRRRRSPDARASLGEAEILLNILLEEAGECDVGSWGEGCHGSHTQTHRAQAEREVREWQRSDEAAEDGFGMARGWMGAGASCANSTAEGGWLSDVIQDRHCEHGNDDCHRVGWGQPLGAEVVGGPKERRSSQELRVVCISHQEQSSDVDVFNIQVSGHPSYYAGGVLVHNCHLIPRNADTMYGRFIADCLEIVPDMRVVGLTATPYRLDSGRLDRGSDRIFERVVYDANVRDLIEQGYLSNLISKATAARIDTSKVHVRGGEFVAGELEAAAMAPEVVQSAVAEIVAMGQDRAGWLAFCTGVDHAKQVRDLMRSHNISCEMVTGDTPSGERDRIINAYKAKQIRCLTSVAVLTTGFNAPHVDLIAMIRPTLSTGLFVQMIGRGLRLAPGKKDCLVLDFAGNSVRHGPVDAVKPQKSGDAGDFYGEEKVKPDTVRAKECPHCQELVGLATIECPSCGHEWPREAPRHEAQALDDAPILSTEKVAEKWLGVDDMRFTIHRKAGSPDSVRIDYLCGVTTHKEWLCFEHSGYPQRKAVELWRRMGGGLPVPKTTDEAMSRKDELSFVTAISVKRNPGTKYFTITDRQVYTADAAE